MTHPSNISFVSCQQMSVLALPECVHCSWLCPHSEQQSREPSLFWPSIPKSTFWPAQQHPISWESFLSFSSTRRRCLALNLFTLASRTWGKSCWAQSRAGPGSPSHQNLFYILIKANKGLEQNHLDGSCSKKAYLGAWPSRETGADGGNHSLQRQGEEKQNLQLIPGLSLSSFTEKTAGESFLHHPGKLWLDKGLSLFCFSRWATGLFFAPSQCPRGEADAEEGWGGGWALSQPQLPLNRCERPQDVCERSLWSGIYHPATLTTLKIRIQINSQGSKRRAVPQMQSQTHHLREMKIVMSQSVPGTVVPLW